jgi:hypothetical protein
LSNDDNILSKVPSSFSASIEKIDASSGVFLFLSCMMAKSISSFSDVFVTTQGFFSSKS